MATFPRTEPQIVALAQAIISGVAKLKLIGYLGQGDGEREPV
jgi:hypothetical protein